MTTKPKPKRIITPKFRVSYPHVFKPNYNALKKGWEYSVTAIFPVGEELKELKAAAHKLMAEQWGPDTKKWPKGIDNPFKKQSDKAKEDPKTGKRFLPDGLTDGALMMTFKTNAGEEGNFKTPPQIVDGAKRPITDAVDFYAGCYAIASVTPFFYDKGKNKGVTFFLGNLQKVAEGEPFSGRVTAMAEFEPIEGYETTSEEIDEEFGTTKDMTGSESHTDSGSADSLFG